MNEGASLGKIIWHSFLYSLVVVPLGIFLGSITCVAGLGAGSAINSDILSALGGLSFFAILIGSFYLSYKLGRDKAELEAAGLMPTPKKPEDPGTPEQGA